MKKLIILFVLTALASGLLSGCVVISNFSGTNAVSGTGDSELYSLEIGEFDKIRIEAFCEVNYYAAPSKTAVLYIQPNLREYYEIETVGGILEIRTTRPVSISSGKDKTPVLTVYSPSINSLEMYGAGSFTAYETIVSDTFDIFLAGAGRCSAELDVRNLNAEMSGAGSFTLSGNADHAAFSIAGAGDLDALSLSAVDASVSLSGVGSVRVNASSLLRIDAYGTGTVEYKGSPTVELNKGGLVNIRHLD